VTSLFHNSPTASHPSVLKTCHLIAKDYWWPNMTNFVANYVKGCATCQSTKANTTRQKPPLLPITTQRTAQPFEHIAMDLIVKLPLSQGYNSILTITDHDCSKAASSSHAMKQLMLQELLNYMPDTSFLIMAYHITLLVTGTLASPPPSHKSCVRDWESIRTSVQHTTPKRVANQSEQING